MIDFLSINMGDACAKFIPCVSIHRQTWLDYLQSTYGITLAANKIFITKKLYKLKMKGGTMMSNHMNNLNTLLWKATSVGMTQDDVSKAIILLCSLLDGCNIVVTVVSTSSSSKRKLVYDEVMATLLSEDM